MTRRRILILSCISIICVYFVTLLGQGFVEDASASDLGNIPEGEWRNICGSIEQVIIRENVAFISFEHASIQITLFKDVYEELHVKNLREHDTVCIIGYGDSYRGKKTFIGRHLGYLTGSGQLLQT